MGTLFDYLEWRGDLTIKQSPFNQVDNVILTHLSYLPFEGIVPSPKDGRIRISIGEAADVFSFLSSKPNKGIKGRLMFKEDPLLLEALGASRRFRSMGLTGFVNHHDLVQEKQFAALTILTGDKSVFVTFRGTDDTIVGWKEDFKMAFSDEIPSQLEAVRYLENISRNYRIPIRLGGHSKGGNLAVYAASFCREKIRERITEIYINDAPGFNNRVLQSEGYKAVRKKIISIIPESSVVGMLFEHDYDSVVVKSTKIGLWQHDIYTWEVLGNSLVSVSNLDQGSRFVDSTIREWMASLDKEQLRKFTEALFDILGSGEAKSFLDFGTDWAKNSMAILQSIGRIDGSTRDMFGKAMFAFLKAAQNNIRILFPQDRVKALPAAKTGSKK